MKKMKFFLGFMSLLAGLTFMACSSGNDDDQGNKPAPPDPVVPTPDNGSYVATKLMGVVTSYGAPLKGVTVTNGTLTAKTDANGVFTFDRVNVVGGRAVLKFSKRGFINIVRSRPLVEDDLWDVAMIPEDNWIVSHETFSSSEARSLDLYGGMNVKMPNAYKVEETGAAYTGNVSATLVYLDPDDEDFYDYMPGGDFAAIRADNSEAQLITYGMVYVELTGDNGEKLQLADGKTATLTFPIPDRLKSKTPEQIPLWSFDEETGLWKEEGVATLQGTVYVGEVSHFSWANLDYPEKRATLNVTVQDSNGKPLPFIPVVLDDEVTYRSNSSGKFQCNVPANTAMDAVVKTESYANLTAPVKVAVPALDGGSTKNITITLPATAIVSGKVTNEGSGSKIVGITIFYGEYNENTSTVYSDMYGNYQIYAPIGYTGEATVVARAADGTRATQTVTLDGTDKTVNLTINSESIAAGAGQIIITYEDGETEPLNLPEISAENTWSGASIVKGNILSVNVDIHDFFDRRMDRLSFEIPNYSTSQEVYDNVSINYNWESNMGWTNIIAIAKVNVVYKNKRYFISFKKAQGTLDRQGYTEKVTLDAEFNVPELSQEN